MKTMLLSTPLLLCLVCGSGCRSIDPMAYPTRVKGMPYPKNSRWHTIRVQAKTPMEVSCLKKTNPVWWFGNADTPDAPEWYRPEQSCREVLWHCRNPLHNFTFYVVGVSHLDTARSGKYPDAVTNPNGGWNYAVTKRGRMRLPFVSYERGKVSLYFGWRPSGNFGIRCDFNKKPKKQGQTTLSP